MEIARNAVKARPGNFQERIWLVKVLMDSGSLPEAESEIRTALAEAKTDPGRWITTLVEFLVRTGRPSGCRAGSPEGRGQSVPGTAGLGPVLRDPGGAATRRRTRQTRPRSGMTQTRQWFVKAKAGQKDPGDPTIDRLFAAFFLRTNQIAEAQKQLSEILGRKDGAEAATTVAWARRNLALTYITGNPRQPAKALAILEAVGRQDGADDPEDLRVLARVLEAQGTPQHLKRAIESPQHAGQSEPRQFRGPVPVGPDRRGRRRVDQCP